MKRFNVNLLLATAISAIAHFLIVGEAARYYVISYGQQIDRSPRGGAMAEATIQLVEEKKPEQPKIEVPEQEIGAADGEGTASHESMGLLPTIAREAPNDQPYLSRDPAGQQAAVEDFAAESDELVHASGLGVNRGIRSPRGDASTADAPQASPSPFGVASENAVPLLTRQAGLIQAKSLAETGIAASDALPATRPVVAPPAPVVEALPVITLRSTVPVAAPRVDEAARPRGGQSAADPAPQSDSEVDAFMKNGTIDVVSGEFKVRLGRKIRTKRPKLGLSGHVDLLMPGVAEMRVKLKIDPRGNVSSVDIVKSTGASGLDQPMRLALYEFWLDPKRDAAGNSVEDEIMFTISFR